MSINDATHTVLMGCAASKVSKISAYAYHISATVLRKIAAANNSQTVPKMLLRKTLAPNPANARTIDAPVTKINP